MCWCGKARLRLEHNLRHPDRPLSLAAVGRIVRWGLESGRIKPCSFWCEGRAKAKRKRSFAGGHAERWRGEDRRRGVQVDHMTLSIDGKVFKEFRAVCPKTRRQVDGGSEFMGEFEAECARRSLPLKVLPPRRPQLNGIVERANRTPNSRLPSWAWLPDGQKSGRSVIPHISLILS